MPKAACTTGGVESNLSGISSKAIPQATRLARQSR
jgi:hypothetical protein